MSASLPEFSIGNVISLTLSLYRQNWIRFSLIVLVPVLLMISFMVIFIGSLVGFGSTQNPQVLANQMSGAWIPIVLMIVLFIPVYIVGQNLLMVMAHMQIMEGKPTLSEAMKRALPTIFPVIGFYLLLMIAFLLFYLVVVLVIGGSIAVIGSPEIGVVLGVLVFLAVIPAVFYFGITILIAVPALVIERCGIITAFRRSNALVRGHRWAIFGLMVILFVAYLAASLVLQVLSLIPLIGIVAMIGSFVIYVAYLAVYSIGPAIIHHLLRVEKDGLDAPSVAAIFD